MRSTNKARRTKTDDPSGNPESTASRNLTRTLMVLLTVSLGAWALLASLIAWHSHNRYKYSRVDLQDQKDVYNEFKAEMKTEFEYMRRELKEGEILREQVSKLVQQFVVAEQKPEGLNQLLDTVAKIHGQLTRESLEQGNIAYMEELLRELLAKKDVEKKRVQPGRRTPPKPTPSPTPDPGDFNTLLNHLADQGYLDKGEVEKAKDQLQKIIAQQNAKPAPTPTPKKPKPTPAPAVSQAPPPPPPKKAAPPTTKPYTHDAMKFATVFPVDWNVKDEGISNGVMAVSPRSAPRVNDAGYATLIVTELRNPQSLGGFFSVNTNETVQVSNAYELLIAGDMEIDKKPAKYARYKHDKVGKKFETLKIVTMNGNLAYVMTFSAPDAVYETKHERNFAQIALSFKFL